MDGVVGCILARVRFLSDLHFSIKSRLDFEKTGKELVIWSWTRYQAHSDRGPSRHCV